MSANRDRLAQQLASGQTSAEDFLKFASKLFTYSFDEISDLYFAKPDLTAVATYEQWYRMGFPVRKGEKGIALHSVMLGTNRNGLPKYKHVFDVTQTRAPKKYGRFIYEPNALPDIKRRYSDYVLNDFPVNNTEDAESTIYDFIACYANKVFNDYAHKDLVVDCAVYTVYARLGLLSGSMSFDFDSLKAVAADPEQFAQFSAYYASSIKTTLLLTREAIQSYEAEQEKLREPEERLISDRAAFDEVANKMYRYNSGDTWHIVKVNTVYTNNKGVQIYSLGGLKEDPFRINLSASDFERYAQEVVIDDNGADLEEQVTEKPEAPVVVITPPIKASVIADFKDITDELFNPIDDFSARDIEGFVRDHIESIFFDNNINASIVDLAIIGSRSRGLESTSSDLDVVVEIKSDIKEDALFNLLHDTEFTIGEKDVVVDINPIRAEESGTLAEYLPRAEKYLSEKEKPDEIEPDTHIFEIYQLKNNDETRYIRFVGLDSLTSQGQYPDISNYDKVYVGDFTEFENIADINGQLDAIYLKFNENRPEDFKGHSLSISDVVVINGKSYYVDDFGFKELNSFITPSIEQEQTSDTDEDILAYAEQVAVDNARSADGIETDSSDNMESAESKPKKRRSKKSNADENSNIRTFSADAEQPAFPITDDMFEHILRCGSSVNDSIYYIISQFAKGANVDENAAFLREHFKNFTVGYIVNDASGLEINGFERRITALFTENQIEIHAGTSSDNMYSSAYFTYEDAAVTIERLLNEGTYRPQADLDNASDEIRRNLAQSIYYLNREIEVQDYRIVTSDLSRSAVDAEEQIYNSMADKNTVREYRNRVQRLAEQFVLDESIVRFELEGRRAPELAADIADYLIPRKTFTAQEGFTFKPRYFVPDNFVKRFSKGFYFTTKFRIADDYNQNGSVKSVAELLKDSYGWSGSSSATGYSYNADSKGIVCYYIDGMKTPDEQREELYITYPELAKQTVSLLQSNSYITQEDIAKYIDNLTDKVYDYWRHAHIKYANQDEVDAFYQKDLAILRSYDVDTDALIERVKADIAAEDENEDIIVEDVVETAQSAGNAAVSNNEPIIVEADEAPEMTPEEAEGEEISQDDLIAYANQVAKNAVVEEPAPENEQLSFFNFSAPSEKPEPTKYFILFKINGRTVVPLIKEYKDSEVDWDGIEKNEGYVYAKYGEKKANAQFDLARIRVLKDRGEFDEDYYMSLIPSPLQEQYKEKVANRHLPIIYSVDENGHIKVKEPYAEMAATLSGRDLNVEYDEVNDCNVGVVTYQSLLDIEQYKDRFAEAGYYAISDEEFKSQSKIILTMNKVGDMWEIYGEDAKIAANVIGLTVIRNGSDVMVGFPDFIRDTYAKQLESAGYGIVTAFPSLGGNTARRNNVVDVTASGNYDHLVASFPAIMRKDFYYMRYEKGERSGYEPFTLEWVGDNVLSIAHTYVQNGDLMDDPEIRLLVDVENGQVQPISYSNSGLGIYKEYVAGDANSRDCNSLVTTLLNNVDSYNLALFRTIRDENGDDIEKDYSDRPLDEERLDLNYESQNDGGDNVYDRLHYEANGTQRKVAEISDTGEVTYIYALTPERYIKEIERYSERRIVDIDLFYANAICTMFALLQEGHGDLGLYYDLEKLKEAARNCKYLDRDIISLVVDLADHSPVNPNRMSDDELSYCLSIIDRNMTDNYSLTDNKISEADVDLLIKDPYLKNRIFTSAVIFIEVRSETERIIAPADIDALVTPEKVYQVITNAGFDGGIDDKSEYSSLDTAIAIGNDYIKDGYLGFCVYNTKTRRIVDVGGDFPLHQAFNPEILRENGYYEEAAQAQALYYNEQQGNNSTDQTSLEELPVEPENENVYDFAVGDVVEVLGSDRQFVITKINEAEKTVEIRDDNTGWYPLFQVLPFEHINSLKDRDRADHDMTDSLIAPAVSPVVSQADSAEDVSIDYVIDNDDLGVGTPRERLAANIAAIELVRKLESEHRYATPDEQKVLAGYVGWGSLADVLDENKENYLSDREKLKELLSEQEYEKIRGSELTAFYTQPVIIRSIYRALSNMGFNGGKILEPSMGIGNFFGMMPLDMRQNSNLYGVELDPITGYIAKHLYQSANISIKGYEDTKFADNSFDVVLGNVPFGDFKVFDTRYDKHNLLIHDYFFIKSLDKVKPGGIVTFITSKGTMDKKDSKVRRMMCERAELLGAIRLPYTAFKSNAGTEAISDIIFLKKRETISAVRENWVDVEYSPSVSSYVNNYFLENPDMICGTVEQRSTQYGFDLNVLPFEDISLEDALNERIEKIQGKYEPIVTALDLSQTKESNKVYLKVIDDSIPDYSFGTTPNGDIVYREGDSLEVIPVSNQTRKQYLAMIRLSRAARYIINVQQEIPTEKTREQNERDFEAARIELNEAYDAFARLGLFVNPDPNSRRTTGVKKDIIRDRNYSLMLSLEVAEENPDGTIRFVKGSPLFERRTIVKHAEITHCDSISDAYMVCLNTKTRVDLNYIAKLSDKTIDEVIGELDGTYIFRNPDKIKDDDITSGWEPSDEYLSGNIRYKLQKAKEFEIKDRAYSKNVSALENVLPAWISAADITCQLGCSWIPEKYISDFIEQVLEFPRWAVDRCEVEHDIKTATWKIGQKSFGSSFTSTSELYGNRDMNGLEVLEHSLNRMSCKIYDRVKDPDGAIRSVLNPKKTAEIGLKQDELNKAFEDWIYKDPYRAKNLEEIYNNLFNSERVRRFDGSFLTFDNMNINVELQPHQKNAVARILFGGNALLAHVVGAGKTFEIAAACMELKRVGAANKSLIVVPNHLLGQWQKEFLTLYPSANLLVATSADFAKDNRKRFVARIATSDYDAIIMGYSTFSKIGISKARRKKYYEDEIDEIIEHLESVESRSLTEKMLQKAKKQLEASLKSLEYVTGQDEELTFEELGVDRLFVDEAHNFKNLQTLTKLGSVKGLQTTRSKRAEDLLLKIRYLTELQGTERGVVLATGTPISNTMTEMFTMQRYLQPSYLDSKGVGHFDAWCSNFCSIEKVIELKPTGVGFRMTKRCAKFNNLPELMMMYNRVADIQTAEMLQLPIPKLKNGQYSIYVCQPSEEQKEFIIDCGERAEAVYSGHVDPSIDNMLKITNDGKMCALDYRLVEPNAEDLPDSKVNIAVRNIFKKWEETASKRLTQIVFLDKSTPKPNGEFNLYDDIRNKLVNMGIPIEEIVFIHEAKNDREKLQMFDDVNAGKIRIILGSTEKMGAGTNIQKKLCALHHIDVPWRPSDIEQREGRILRRGNENEEVEIFRYVTEQTFDAYSWQTIENKQRFISQVMTGEAAGRSAEDVDNAVLNYAQIKSLATGDERIKEHFDLTEEVKRLKLLKGSFDKAHIAMRDRLTFELPKELQKETRFVKIFKAAKEYAVENSKPFNQDTNPFNVTFCGRTFDKREDAGNKVFEIIKSGAAFNEEYKIGVYRGFDFYVTFSAANNNHILILRHGDCRLDTLVSDSPIGITIKLDNLIDKDIDRQLVGHSEKLSAVSKEIETCEKHKDDVFPQEAEYLEKSERLKELTKALSFDEVSDKNADMLDDDDDTIGTSSGEGIGSRN